MSDLSKVFCRRTCTRSISIGVGRQASSRRGSWQIAARLRVQAIGADCAAADISSLYKQSTG